MSASHAVFHPLPVASVEPVTEDSVAITFDVPPGLAADYAHVQGQHVTIRTELAGDDVRRNYSICSPAGSGILRVAVKRLPGGAFSGHAIDALRPGDVLDVMTPTGRFFTQLDPASRRHHVCVAAGSGVTPVLSIVATTLAVEPRSSVTLLYGNRTHRSVMFLEELEDLKDTYPDRFQLVHVLSREPQQAELFSGRIDVQRMRRLIDGLLPVDAVDEWFLCGPFQMVSDLRRLLVSEGVPKRAVHAEVFHVDTAAPVQRPTVAPTVAPTAGDEIAKAAGDAIAEAGAEEAEVTITLDGRRSSFTLAPDGPSVLEAALAVRADAPFACRGGVCGTCRARLLEGTVEMDTNWALEPEELARGFVLTCQAHPTSDRLAVDYDA